MTTAELVGADVLGVLLSENSFPPSTGTELLKKLRREVLRARQAAFVALMLRISGRAQAEIARGAEEGLERFLALEREERTAVAADPALSIWLQRTARLDVGNNDGLAQGLADFPAVLARCIERLGRDDLNLPLPVEIVRYVVDPAIAEVAPPTYTFPTQERGLELEATTAYSLEIFSDVATAALTRIGTVWPELREMFPYYVRTIVHLPYADFRSASASRYAGVILLTADDKTLLELEESIVHEWGHQLLYAVMELDPIVVDGDQDDLALPWSGARRDFYGYFHALFVYTLLLRYLERINDRDEFEMERVRKLFGHILRGAVRALPDFDEGARFTQRGLELRQLLWRAVTSRAAANPDLVEGDIDDPNSRASDG